MKRLVLVLIMCCSVSNAQTISTQEVLRMPQAKADHRIPYGPRPQQFADLYLPHPNETSGGPPKPGLLGWGSNNHKFPVAIIIHGGCWSSQYDLAYMGNMSAALAQQGIATWSIEYRRVGDPGGGWPGTFQDVAAAADHLRELASRFPLDLTRVVAVGHSAGAHLALWLAARHKLPKSSELYSADPIALRGVVSLAGIPDRAAAGADTGCVDMGYQLMGGQPRQLAVRYQQGSPAELLPLSVKQLLIHGEQDKLVPFKLSVDYELRAKKSGDDVKLIAIPNAGHFELVVPTTTAWKTVQNAVSSLTHEPLLRR